MPLLGKMPWEVQDAHKDVRLDDVLLEVDVCSKLMMYFSMMVSKGS